MHKSYLLYLEEINHHPHWYFLLIYTYKSNKHVLIIVFFLLLFFIVDFRMIHINSMIRVDHRVVEEVKQHISCFHPQ